MSDILKKYPRFRKRVENHEDYTDYGPMIIFWCNCPCLIDDRCGIYNDRPDFCKAYPFIMSPGQPLRVAAACPKWVTVDSKDYYHANRAQARHNGRFKANQNKWSRILGPDGYTAAITKTYRDIEHHEERDSVKNAQKLSSMPELDIWIPAKEFLEKKAALVEHGIPLETIEKVIRGNMFLPGT
jgi:Fe-S-cluster containining protein